MSVVHIFVFKLDNEYLLQSYNDNDYCIDTSCNGNMLYINESNLGNFLKKKNSTNSHYNNSNQTCKSVLLENIMTSNLYISINQAI